MTALMLLAPGTPLIFQGQEFAASSPFLYFADLKGELAKQTGRGRAEFLAQFPSIATPEIQNRLLILLILQPSRDRNSIRASESDMPQLMLCIAIC
jgi:hypothetical protein